MGSDFEDDDEKPPTWGELCASLEVDRRVRRGILDLKWERPTLVQRAAIPVGLEGRDVLIHARTGSGKTACYAVPVLARLLKHKDVEVRRGEQRSEVLAVVLGPTRELVAQARRQLSDLGAYCGDAVGVVALLGERAADDAKRVAHNPRPDVLVATPAALHEAIEAAAATSAGHPLSRLGETVLAFVVDEADLVLSFGYDEDVEAVLGTLGLSAARGAAADRPQGFLVSATLGDDVAALKRVALRKAATVRLCESAGVFGGDRDDEAALAQYVVPVSKDDKYLVVYVLLKLGLLEGRGILFVNDVDECYRLKLFLDLFSIRCLVLNAELPLASRLHAIDAYNRGYYDLLVATDAAVSAPATNDDDEDEMASSSSKKKKKKKKSKEEEPKSDDAYGVARGIDFRNVSWVLNVDFPRTRSSYTHRVGRTARAGARGTALSLVAPSDASFLEAVRADQPPVRLAALATGGACSVVAALGTQGVDATRVAQPVDLAFDAGACEPFRYRVADVKRGVTRAAVREARAAELRKELLNSKQLEAHFAQNPNDLDFLKRDRIELHVRRDLVAENVKKVPSYLVPQALKAVGAQPRQSFKRKKTSHRAGVKRKKGQPDQSRRKDNDPLQTFDASGLRNLGDADAKLAPKKNKATPNAAAAAARPTAKVFSDSDLAAADGPLSNRAKWKQQHKKGSWAKNPKTSKRPKKFARGDSQAFRRKKI
ncbi:hypothetical protein CTAYLR_003708 [Chrysophaeum taylorii]|uniref:RNA helicase n=1 Tax=Chrysophaeum taylorii TaxID=2483200 RepID=A0AAD7UMB1_9STRA|nr:hypothetical protein CTAYLR_003708 [Chrysophaeum taylorii]